MVKIFQKIGYLVNSPDEKQNFGVNMFDGFLIFIYVLLSFINLGASTPSELVFYLNAITLGRLILKNIIEQSKIAKNCKGTDTIGITLIHVIKIAIEGTLMISLVSFYLWGKLYAKSLDVITLVVAGVLIVTLLDNILAILERIYDASPKPLKC